MEKGQLGRQESQGVREMESLLRPGNFQSGYGRLRMLRFLAQVMVVAVDTGDDTGNATLLSQSHGLR